MKHFTQIADFTKEEYVEIFRRANLFKKGGDFTDLCRGKVLGLAFFQESTRTVASFQSAMTRLGGGWLGITSPTGTYIVSGEEDASDTLWSLADYADLMVVRDKSLNLSELAKGFPIPLMNGMCGGEEHTSGALWIVDTMQRRFGDLSKVKFGVYGMTKSSRPMKAMMKLLSMFGTTIYEDTVIPEFKAPDHIVAYAAKNGVTIKQAKLDEFIGEVDVLFVTEGLPQSGEDPKLVEEFNKKVQPANMKTLERMKKGSVFFHSAPRSLTDGRLMIEKDVDRDPRVMMHAYLHDGVFVNMALYTYLLGLKV